MDEWKVIGFLVSSGLIFMGLACGGFGRILRGIVARSLTTFGLRSPTAHRYLGWLTVLCLACLPPALMILGR